MKISCSCVANIKSIINMHNKEVITEKKTKAVHYNCINKPDCPISIQCQITKKVYKEKIASNLQIYCGTVCFGNSKGTFRQQN